MVVDVVYGLIYIFNINGGNTNGGVDYDKYDGCQLQ